MKKAKAKAKSMLREQLLMSQQDFAHYRGISRNLLSLYEKGLRSLPKAALIKLGNMEIMYHQTMQKSGRLKK